MATTLAAPNVAGYSFDQAPDLTDAQERRKLSESAIKVFVNIAQKWDLTATELARNVHTHPTMSEALQECFHGLVGHMINF